MSGYVKAGRTPALGAPTASDLQKFFESKRAAAVLKHEILSGYLVPFASKVGSSSPGGRVVVVDGYAGAGRYDDGQPGSPALIAKAAQDLDKLGRHIESYFVEKDPAHYQRLRVVLQEEGGTTLSWEALQGTVEQHLQQLLQRATGLPLLLFLDPFGLGLPFHVIVDVFKARPAGAYVPATEVLFRFDAGAIRRTRGVLYAEEYPARQGTLESLDRAAGGSWWREEDDPALTGEAYTDWFMSRLLQQLCTTAGCSGWSIDVRHRQELQPAYYLVFLTRHPDGMKVFADRVSCAQDKWRRAVFDEAMDEEERKHGGTPLFDLREDLFKGEEALLRDQWVEQLEGNVRRLLQDTPRFVVRQRLDEVFAGVLGVAREKHLRPALKKLHQEGATSSDSKGDLWEKTVIRA